MSKLFIVIPAYNEEENIFTVATEWHDIVVKTGVESRLLIIDDGSKDDTYKVLTELGKRLPQLLPITKPNSGHGATILYGYNYALKQNADYIFQTDSDGQTSAEEFWQFWEQRDTFSVLIGYRNRREDGFSRIFVTKILKIILWCIFRLNITDANTPFRLMKTEILRKYIGQIPPEYNLTNVIIAVLFVKYNESVKFIPVSFKKRQGGVNSINLKKIVKIGIQALKDFIHIKNDLDKRDVVKVHSNEQ